MSLKEEFEPVSELAGEIEVVLNAQNIEDPYAPIDDNLVLSIGKTGRANRITFKHPSINQVEQLIEAFTQVKEELEAVADYKEKERQLSRDFDNETYNAAKNILVRESKEGGIDKSELIETIEDEAGIPEEKAETLLTEFKRNGDAFEPEEGKIQFI